MLVWYDDQAKVIYTGFAGRMPSLGNVPQAYPLGIWPFTPDGKGGGIWNDTINSKSSFWKQITRP